MSRKVYRFKLYNKTEIKKVPLSRLEEQRMSIAETLVLRPSGATNSNLGTLFRYRTETLIPEIKRRKK
jgi:hypothetical protein